MPLPKPLERLLCVYISFLMHLLQRQLKMRIGRYREADHLHALLIRGAVPVFLCGGLPDGINRTFSRENWTLALSTQNQMSDMDGVKMCRP